MMFIGTGSASPRSRGTFSASRVSRYLFIFVIYVQTSHPSHLILKKIKIKKIKATYKFFYESEGSRSPFYKAVGSFSSRSYSIYSRGKSRCASVSRSMIEISDRIDRYVAVIAKGVDPVAIVAMAVVIDEDHDEEDEREREEGKKKKKEEGKKKKKEKGGGWPF